MSGRALQIVAGFGLALGIFPQWSAVGLLAFLVPATLFQPLLLQFGKNLAMCGGLLFVAASPISPHCFQTPRHPLFG
jgi:uncharacterized membrane protein YphA (DoxX/SURF4 family)